MDAVQHFTKGFVPMKTLKAFLLSALALAAMGFTSAKGQGAAAPTAEEIRSQAAKEQKYVFLVFYKANDQATQAAAGAVKDFCAAEGKRAVCTFINVAASTEAAIVKEYGVDRAPMPLVLAVAPTGAVTGAFPKKATAEQLASAFVTPSMAHCMKAMQDGQLAMLCTLATPESNIPQVASEFAADPAFAMRTVVVTALANDPGEAELFKELKVAGPGEVVLFAPPGTLVGHFGATATKDQIAAALHQAGKCCEDPNCKHSTQAAASGSTTR
jgi:hypothetical protein